MIKEFSKTVIEKLNEFVKDIPLITDEELAKKFLEKVFSRQSGLLNSIIVERDKDTNLLEFDIRFKIRLIKRMLHFRIIYNNEKEGYEIQKLDFIEAELDKDNKEKITSIDDLIDEDCEKKLLNALDEIEIEEPAI